MKIPKLLLVIACLFGEHRGLTIWVCDFCRKGFGFEPRVNELSRLRPAAPGCRHRGLDTTDCKTCKKSGGLALRL